ncbi:ABC transporter ATP-binding protein [Corynebacterium comes]|uniref:Daunorubicin/doxorubicin resistance ATP-binding protein DrrA n=1 Tax=Corynebacterium comes TaxID=2675218 RepID=A0A6B8VU48_9CORY|nr:ABC transporter ATP-binding protein [Corynebacterium comes]QGU04894.1 Daunorubicin/doxorubicin resistance ATP-binding protein DrrA [Corynebacterium comes]
MPVPHLPPLVPDPITQALSVRDLTKVFGEQRAVDKLSLDIPRGSIYGVVGPNGAGKTTMITMAAGLARPTGGRAWIAGHDVWADPMPAKRAMGLLVDGVPVFDRLSGREYLSYLGGLRGIEPREVGRRSTELLDALGLADAGGKFIVDYSAGMTKKILLAGALLHNPEILILDEPLEAVDPVSGRLIQQILRDFAARGGTVVLSSHVMELVEGLCDHVAIIDHGRVLSAGHVDDVRQGSSLVDTFVGFVGGGELAEGALGWLRGEVDHE